MRTSPQSSKVNFVSVRSFFFFGLILLFGVGILYIFQPFIYPLFWAAIIAAMFHPVYRFFSKHTKMPSISSALTLLLVIAILFIPLAGVSILVVQQSIDLYNTLAQSGYQFSIGNATNWIAQTPLAPYHSAIVGQFEAHAGDIAKNVTTLIIQNFATITQISASFAFKFCIMMYALYYFLKDGDRMLKRLIHLSPLGDTYEQLLFTKFTSTSRATLKSTLIIGGVQGTLGGLLFFFTGIPAPVVWGIVMIAFSIIPGLGSFVVWFPAGIITLLMGDIQTSIIILVGGFIISLVDNLLRPPLLGHDTQMHPLVVLLSTLGGLLLFGVSGFVIGPVLAALFIAIIDMYDHYYRDELINNRN